MKKLIRTVSILLLFALLLTGCTGRVNPTEPAAEGTDASPMPENPFENSNNGTSCANITMCNGDFTYQDSIFYFIHESNICTYDLGTGQQSFIPIDWRPLHACLHIAADQVFFEAFESLMRIAKDGQELGLLYSRDNMLNSDAHIYAEEQYAYIWSPNGRLLRRDLQTGEETNLLYGVVFFDMDDTAIYVTADTGEQYQLFRTEKDVISFDPIELSFSPGRVIVSGDTLYLAEYDPTSQFPDDGLHQIIRYTGGVETRLPIYANAFQVLNGQIIYIDETSCTSSTHYIYSLKSYDPDTGEERLLGEEAFSMLAVFEQRYVCYHALAAGKTEYRVYDWQTGETTVMYPS